MQDKQALKTGEAKEGIDCLWTQTNGLPDVFSPYLELLHALNQNTALRYYPGSPAIAIHALRAQDRLVCCELHPGEFQHLQQLNTQGKRVSYEQVNGIDKLKALLPPIERRALIFIDPSYEIKTEYQQIPAAVKDAYQRFATGVYCIWYPLVDKQLHAKLLRGFKEVGADQYLRVEFYLGDDSKPGMTGTGLWIINPPYILHNQLKTALTSLCRLINPGISSYLLEAS